MTDAAHTTAGVPDPVPEPVHKSPKLLRGLRIGTIIVQVTLLVLAPLMWQVQMVPGLNIGLPLLLLPLAHFGLSWRGIQEDEWGAFFFFGRPLTTGESGPHFVPFGLVRLRTAPKRRKQAQFPDEPENVFHGGDEADLPPGMVRPIFITTRAPREGETAHLDVQMTAKWSFYVQFQIYDLLRFFSIVGSFEHAQRLIRDTGEAVLNEFAAQYTMGGMIEHLADINQTLDNRIRALVNQWGMQVYETKALAPNLSHSLSEELRNVPIVRLKAEQTKTTAEAERVRLEQEGAGAASALAARLKAEADGREQFLTAEATGLKAKKKMLGISGEDVLAAEVASDALKHADSIIVGADGIKDLAGMAVAAKRVLGTKKE